MKYLILIGIIASLLMVSLVWYVKSKPGLAEKNEVAGERIEKTQNPPQQVARQASLPVVLLHTNVGDIEVELWSDRAPKTVENFLKLAQQGFYNDVKFHRVIQGFMIQTGDPLSKDKDIANDGTGGPGYTIIDEFHGDDQLIRGVVAMANTGQPNSGGSQFFVVTAEETPWLNGKHTAFGKVVSGLDVVDQIESTQVNDRDQPLTPVIIQSIDVIVDSDKI